MSILSKLFNSEKKDTTYRGTKPVSSLTQVKGGNEYYNTIQDRLAGRNVGFGDSYASTYANPIVKNMRANFEDYQMPELEAELSRTGRRKGSGGFTQIAQAYKEQGNQEGDIFSRLQQRNEDQMRNEINDALGRTGDFAQNEANLVDRLAAFDYGDHTRQVTEAAQRRANESAGMQNLVFAGADALMGMAGGVGGVGMRQAPQVNYGGVTYPVSTPPQGYALPMKSNTMARLATRYGQAGRVL